MAVPTKAPRAVGVYKQIIERIFLNHYKPSLEEFEFSRDEIEKIGNKLKVKLPKNLGDLIYSFRYRVALPDAILKTAKPGYEWIIEGAGDARYRFVLSRVNRIVPRASSFTIKIPDSTPEIINAHALGDEQALLAKLRYNRLLDIFLGIAAYSLQNHLRTKVPGIGQIEIDEIYVGVDKHGRQFVIPVQAKGGKDQHGATQTLQDIECCRIKFPGLICRAVSAQFISPTKIALFELTVQDGQVKIFDEKQYDLVAASEISAEDLASYKVPIS